MKVGIVGLPQVGKKTLFQLLTGTTVDPNTLAKGRLPTGVANVIDERLDRLTEMYEPQKKVAARIEFNVISGVETADSPAYGHLEKVDIICIMIRDFKSEQVFHIKGDVNPDRDLEMVLNELCTRDWMFLEKRLEKMEKEKNKKKTPNFDEELKLFTALKDHLEEQKPARLFDLNEEQLKVLAPYPLITLKNVVVIVNTDDDRVNEEEPLASLEKKFAEHQMEWAVISAQLEEEVASLGSEEEKKEFLDEFGIDQPALPKLTQTCYRSLGLISFFTVGKDECRAWMVKKGSLAPRAARAIHTDLEKGFIRAEVMKYDDLIEQGDEKKVKEVGKYLTKGKDYLVVDGDIINILHN